MIENLRHYTGLIIVLFVLVIIGFFIKDYSSMNKSGVGGSPYMKVAGRTYTDKEFNQLGVSSYKVTQILGQSGDFQLFSFLFGLSGEANFGSRESMDNFFASRMLLRSAKEEFGIYPGDEEIDSFIRKLRAFTGPNGEFSQEQYRSFIEKGIGRLGLTEGDIRDLASDMIAQTKIVEILGAGLTTNRDAVAKNSALEGQRIALEIARIDLDPIEAKIDPSEQEIKTYWETTREAYKTLEKRSFIYLIAKPVIPADPAELPAPAVNATEEAKANYEKAKAKRDSEMAESHRKAQNEIGALVDNFLFELEEQKQLPFEKLATANKWEVKTTELFSLADAPEELKATLRASSTPGTGASELFRMVITSDPLSKISPAIPLGENEWLIARLDGIEEARTQTYEEARVEVRARLIAEQAATALRQATEKAAEKIKTAIAGGKSFAEAAKEAGINSEIIGLTEVTAGYKGDASKVPSTLFNNAKYTDPGALTPPVIESDRAFIIHVTKREILKREDAVSSLESDFERALEGIRISAFNSWLAAKIETSGVETLYNK